MNLNGLDFFYAMYTRVGEKHADKCISDCTYAACVNGFRWQLQCASHLIGMSTFPFPVFVFVCGS